MKKLFVVTLFIIPCVAYCQNVGIGTTAPVARLQVADSNVVFTGPANVSQTTAFNPPVQGQGTRMMWYPQKAAFRAGYVYGKVWDKDSIGNFSFAAGFDSKAIGAASAAMGNGTNALGDISIAMGYLSTASGYMSTAIGNSTVASGTGATAMGGVATASGNFSTATGVHTIAPSFAEMAIGSYNTDYIPFSIDNWNAADRLFVIGNGDFITKKDAMVVLKSGNVGIGTSNPVASLAVSSPANPQLLIQQTVPTDYARARLQTGSSRFWDIAAINKFEGVLYDRLHFFNSDAGNILTIAGNGHIGIGNDNPNADLQFSGSVANRKIVFYEGANNDHQFNGFGLNPGVLRYQVNNPNDDHVFYTGTSASTSDELVRIKGNGNVGIGNPAPSSKLEVNGAMATTIKQPSVATVILDNSATIYDFNEIHISANPATILIKLPTASSCANRRYMLVNRFNYSIQIELPGYFDFSYTFNNHVLPNGSIELVSNGTDWVQIK